MEARSFYAAEKLFGEVRGPRDEREEEELENKLSSIPCGLLDYQPHPKQSFFHRAGCRTKLFLGSNQSGKTTAMLAEILSWAIGRRLWSDEPVLHPVTGLPIKPPIRAMIGALDYVTSHSETIIPKMRELLPLEIFVKQLEKIQGRVVHRLQFYNGSSIKLMSYQSDPGAWEGPTYHIAAFDEPPPNWAYIATKRGCMKHLAPILFSMTPLEEPWIYDQLFTAESSVHVSREQDLKGVKKTSIFVTTVDLDENPYLDPVAKAEFVRGLDDEQREARQHGRFKHLMGRVYKTFSDDYHMMSEESYDAWQKAWDRSWPSGFVVDPHDRKPFAMGAFVVTPRDEVVWVWEWPSFDFYEAKSCDLKIEDYAKVLRGAEEQLKLERVVWWWMDPNFGRTRSVASGRTTQEDFEAHGIWFDTEVDDDIASGHLQVREWLGKPPQKPSRMYWAPHLRNFRKGMSHYTWENWEKGRSERAPKERPADRYKDFPDLVRYALKGGARWIPREWTRPKPILVGANLGMR